MKKVAEKFAKSKMFIVSLHRQSRKTKMLANRGARVAQQSRSATRLQRRYRSAKS